MFLLVQHQLKVIKI